MQTLYLISVALWIFIAYEAIRVFLDLRDKGLSRREVTSVTILLLCGLNISRGILTLVVGTVPKFFPGQVLLEYFYIGSSVFSLLLCSIVLKYIKPKTK